MAMNRQQWTLVSGLGMGAGLMYLLDPQAGGRRRALVRDKAVSAYSSGSDVVRKTSRDLGNRSKGLAAEVRSKLKKDDADDLVLRDRVRSKMGRWVSKPGAIDVTVADSVVTLRGHVSENEVDHLLKKVRKVKGVEDVVCELAIGDSEDASSLLSEGEEIQGSTRNWSKAARLLAGTAGGALAVAALAQRSKLSPALGATLGTVGLGLLAGGVGGSNVNPTRLLRRRGHGQDLGQDLTDGESGQSFEESGDSFEPKSLADSGGDGSAVRHDSFEHGKSASKSERFDYEPVHTH